MPIREVTCCLRRVTRSQSVENRLQVMLDFLRTLDYNLVGPYSSQLLGTDLSASPV